MDTALQLPTFVYPFGVSFLKGSNPLTELFAAAFEADKRNSNDV